MLCLANSFLWHKKSSYFLIFIISISLALMLLIVPLFNGIITSVQSSNISRYGSHHFVVFDITKEKLDAYMKDTLIPIDAEGCIYNYGNYPIEGTKNTVTIGYFDDAAYEIGKMELLEGRLPANNNELAIEQNALYRISERATLGDTLTLEVNGSSMQFRISGILFDYSNRWTGYPLYELGYTDYPQGITAKDAIANTASTQIWLVRMQDENALENIDFVQFLSFTFYPDHENGKLLEKFAGNSNALNANSFSVPFAEFRELFLIVLLIGTFIAIVTSLGLHYANYAQSYQTLYNLGAKGSYTFGLHTWQNIYAILVSAIVAIGLAYGISAIMSLLTGEISYSILHKDSLLWPGVTLLFILLYMELYYLLRIQPMRKLSMSQHYGSKPVKGMRIRGGVTFSLFRSFLKQNWVRTMAAVLMIAVLTAALSVSIPQIAQLAKYGEEEIHDMDFWFAGDPNIGEIGDKYRIRDDGFSHMVAPVDMVQKLDANNAVDFIMAELATNVSLILPEETPYWKAMNAQFYHIYDEEGNITGYSEEFVPYEIKDAPSSTTLQSPAFYLLTATTLRELQTYIPSIKGDLSLNEVLAIFPPTKEDTVYSFIKPGITEELYAEGDTLHLGYATGQNSDDVISKKEIPQFKEDSSLKIGEVYKQSFSIDPNLISNIWAERPTFFITAETAAENDLFRGVNFLYTYLKKPNTSAEYESAKADFVRVALTVPNAQIEITADNVRQNKLLGEAINTSCIMLFVVFGIFCFSTFYAVMYLSLLRRKRSLGIYRSLGMKKRSLFIALYAELLIYWLFAMLLAMALCIPAGMHVNMWMLDLDEVPQFFPYVGYVAAAGIVLCAIIVWTLVRRVYKESIASSIKTAE